MQLLPDKLRKNHFDYTKIHTGGRSFVFCQCYEGNIIGYEVFRLKINKACVFHGVNLPERQAFPGNEDFGKWAWSYREYKDAMKKFNELENEQL